MPEKSHPRRGSLAYTPRKRAPRERARVRAWPEDGNLRPLGFAGYKAGMTHLFMIDDREGSLTENQEINVPVTILDAPPLLACAGRMYGSTPEGKKVLTDVWTKNLAEDLSRTVKFPKEYDHEASFKNAEEFIEEGMAVDIRILAHTQPRLSSVPKKKPEIIELQVGGDSVDDKWDYVKEILGDEIRISEPFGEGEYADVIAITKGKGFEGPVQRWGVKVQPRKVQQARRHVGVLGPWRPRAIMRSVPSAGQTGYHQRTEYNKRILKIGKDGGEVTPNGGFLRFGEIQGEFVILAGSVPGPTKRLVLLRRAMREKEGAPSSPPTITHIDTSSQQGG